VDRTGSAVGSPRVADGRLPLCAHTVSSYKGTSPMRLEATLMTPLTLRSHFTHSCFGCQGLHVESEGVNMNTLPTLGTLTPDRCLSPLLPPAGASASLGMAGACVKGTERPCGWNLAPGPSIAEGKGQRKTELQNGKQ
jgi:hypothetical protein